MALKKSEISAYAFYTVALTLFTSVSMSYTNIYMTDHLLYSAALMGTTLLVGRIVDFIIGLLAGGIIGKSNLKWGKYRSWTMICRFTAFAGTVLLFTNTSSLPTAAKVAITILGYILMHGSMDFLQPAQFGILSSIAGADLQARNTLSIRGAQAMAVSSIIASATVIPLINFFTPFVGAANAYTVVAVLYGLIFLFGATFLIKAAAPYDQPQKGNANTQAPTPTVSQMFKSVVTNNQLLVYLSSSSLMYIGMMLMQSSMAYYFTYVLGDFLLMSVSMTATTSFAVVASIIGPKIGVKLGKKNAMVVGLLINTASLLSITFLAKESLIIYIILSCINSLGMYTFTGFGPNYVIDAGEYHYYKTGVDNRALAMGMMNMPIKIGFIIGGTLAGYALQAIGYTAGMTVTPEFVSKFMWVFTGIPSAFYLLGAIIMFLGYKITDEDAAMYAKANAERMAKAIQQA